MKQMNLSARIFGSLSLLVLFGANVGASAEAEGPLSLGVTGSTPSEPARNPIAILRPVEVQRLLLEIGERPHSRQEIESAVDSQLFSIDDAVAVGLLREEDGLFHIDFNLLTVADQRRILEVTEDLGRELADAFLERRGEFESLAARHRQSLAAEFLYVVLGCFSLDWDGLDLTEELGYRAGAQRTIDGNSFTPWAKEKGADVSLRGLYWGSHNDAVEGITLTTFGDHAALPRFASPDLWWRSSAALRGFEDRPEAQRVVQRMFSAYKSDSKRDAGRVMMELGRGGRSAQGLAESTGIEEIKLDRMLALLEEAQYVERRADLYEATALVLRAEDAELVGKVVAMGRTIMTRWHEKNYERVAEALAGLTPVRNGVPFERVYTEIWHFLFGIANRTLVEERLFADPYAAGRRHEGFLPAIWASSLTEE